MQSLQYARHILALPDTDLEHFVRDWIGKKTAKYYETKLFSGTGDLGRDVVGFHTSDKHDGKWDNYQCKQYGRTIPTDTGLLELGKILYYAYKGEFTAPETYVFVAPRGINRNLEKLIFSPAKLRHTLISEWDKYCANKIIDKQNIPLDVGLRAFLQGFNFATVTRMALDDILLDPDITSVLFTWFGADPGPSPKGVVPLKIQDTELPYIKKLIEAYGQREGKTFKCYEDIEFHNNYKTHLSRQRTRFYDAAAFKRFYRDNTNYQIIKEFEDDILHGVIETCESVHLDSLTCADAVMAQAAVIQAAGPIAHHAKVPVKQGVCHHLANDDILRW